MKKQSRSWKEVYLYSGVVKFNYDPDKLYIWSTTPIDDSFTYALLRMRTSIPQSASFILFQSSYKIILRFVSPD